jgi:hypothetical protein
VRGDSQRQAELLKVAERCRGRRTAADLMADMTLLLAHVMTYGEIEDVVFAQRNFTQSEFLRVLDEAPAKVFDPWSWNYLNFKFNRPVPPKPDEWFAFKYIRRTGKGYVTAQQISTVAQPKVHWY